MIINIKKNLFSKNVTIIFCKITIIIISKIISIFIMFFHLKQKFITLANKKIKVIITVLI
jgi:hypothetical protein